MLGLVPIPVLQDQASVDTFLYLSLSLIGLLFRSRVGSPTYLVTPERGFSLRSICTSLSQEAGGGSSRNTSR